MDQDGVAYVLAKGSSRSFVFGFARWVGITRSLHHNQNGAKDEKEEEEMTTLVCALIVIGGFTEYGCMWLLIDLFTVPRLQKDRRVLMAIVFAFYLLSVAFTLALYLHFVFSPRLCAQTITV